MARSGSSRGRNRRSGKQARATLNRSATSRSARPDESTTRNMATTMESTGIDASFAISREQEYAYIRSDLRRLLVIAACLLAVMFGLLFVIG